MQLVQPLISENTKSHAERYIFSKLQDSNIKGVAIYSLDLSKHQYKLYSEINFVIIIERGVLCWKLKAVKHTKIMDCGSTYLRMGLLIRKMRVRLLKLEVKKRA